MNLFKTLLSFVFIIILVQSCVPNREENKRDKEPWFVSGKDQAPQILLTNSYKFKERESVTGASSFLLFDEGDTVLCTAKHLLGDAMGVNPEVNINSFDSLLEYWHAYPRVSRLSSDSIQALSVINNNVIDKDIMFLKIKQSKRSIQALRPNYEPLFEYQNLYIIGCEYKDFDCHQKFRKAKMLDYEEGMMIMTVETPFDLPGFSGCPIIDKNGFVVGTLRGAGTDEQGRMFISAVPISFAKKWLNKRN